MCWNLLWGVSFSWYVWTDLICVNWFDHPHIASYGILVEQNSAAQVWHVCFWSIFQKSTLDLKIFFHLVILLTSCCISCAMPQLALIFNNLFESLLYSFLRLYILSLTKCLVSRVFNCGVLSLLHPSLISVCLPVIFFINRKFFDLYFLIAESSC